ncbi:ArsR/SmtB family transcription factor [Plantactinospora sp. GCM10030261]|uniref:ArsR/SmtB family transcription factor n=1 Tax=Plantactinospora sp. GCM10030261 TaxID=3273420 RepID=UPI0036089CA1
MEQQRTDADAPQPVAAPQASCADLPQLAESTHDFLKALASPTRQRIMMLFARGAELSVGEIATRVGISHATASQQLMLLRRGKVVVSRRDGKTVLYRADRDGSVRALTDLREYLMDCC